MRITKKIAFPFLMLCSMVFSAPSIWDGSADVSWYEPSAHTYNLITAEQLAGLAKLVNDGTSNFLGKKITLGADIFLNDTTGAGDGSWVNKSHRNWIPIGLKNSFCGEFDGRKNKIYGLYVNSSGTSFVGLFGSTHYAKISFLEILVGKISANRNVGAVVGFAVGGSITDVYAEVDVNGKDHIGGLVGYITTGSIERSSEMGDVVGRDSVGGLVGYISGKILGSIKKNSFFEGSVRGRMYVGGAAGVADTILNTYVEAKVMGDSDYIGGIVGYANGAVNGGYHIDGEVRGFSYVGGLVGLSHDSVLNSYSKGNVIGENNYVGGLVGYANGTVNRSYRIDGEVRGFRFVGGLVGLSYDSVLDSYSKGNVIGENNYVGGLVGLAKGTVNGSYHIDGEVCGFSYVGGLVGYSESSVVNSHFEGNVYGSSDYVGGIAGYAPTVYKSYAKSTFVKGRNIVGGIAGFVRYMIGTSYFAGDSVIGVSKVGGLGGLLGGGEESNVDNSYSTANVKGDDNVGGLVGYQYSGSVSKSLAIGNVSGITKLGGLVGCFEGTSISQSYANGNVTGDYYGDSANEVGDYYIGGLVGYAKGSLTETYASGVVKGMDKDSIYTGCIVGYVKGSLSISKSYYDETKCDLGVVGGKNAANVSETSGKTTAEMQTQSTFVDWDFTNVWRIEDATYPFLQFFANSLTNSVVTTELLEGIVYDGLPQTPSVSTMLFGDTLTENVDYTVKYEKNVNAGTAKIIVCGINLYSECKYIDFTIEKATPVISQNPKASDVLIDEALASSDLSDGMSDVEGVFVWKSPEIKPTLENEGYAVEFIPTDANNYNSVEFIIPIKVWDIAYVAVHLGNMTLDSVVVIKGNTYTLPMVSDSVGYDFVGFYNGNSKVGDSGDEIVVDENTVLDAVFIKTFVVKFANGNVELQSEELASGSIPQYKGDTPVKNATAQWTYAFKGWYPAVSSVTGPATYMAAFDSVVNKYIVTFMNGDTELQSSEVAYGMAPSVPEVPLPENTAQYTYSFDGWDKPIVAVIGAETYSAVINRTLNKYDISFRDYDGTTLNATVQYDYGTSSTNIAKPINPTRQESAKYTYNFKGWNPTISDVTENAVYVAEYDSIIRGYQIVFINGNDKLQLDTVAYGEVPAYIGGVPTRETTAQWTYTFKEWTPKIEPVVETATYTAAFDSVINKYEIVFKDYDGSVLKTAVQYDFGTPLYNIVEPINPIRQETEKCVYTFNGWRPTISDVTENTVYVAEYDCSIRNYAITFVNGSKGLQSSKVAYGKMPFYRGGTPTKAPTDSCEYVFVGWDPELKSVTGNAVYSAKFDEIKREYLVRFMNDDKLLEEKKVVYGEIPKYTGETPTKASSKSYSYEFIGWSPKLRPVTRETEFIAVFDSTSIAGMERVVGLNMSIHTESRSIQIFAAPLGVVYAIFDMQGRELKKGRVEFSNFNIVVSQAGTYFVRVGSHVQRININ